MPRSGKRHRIATGIYRDGTGIASVVRVRGQRKEQRYPLGTSVTEIRADMQRLRLRLEAESPQRAIKGTLEAIVTGYLDRLPEGRAKVDRRDLLTPWVDALGAIHFARMTRPQIIETLMRWESEGLSAPTRNKRLSALRVLWRTVASDDVPHPCERVKRAPSPREQRNRARPLELIRLVLTHVAPTTNKAKGADSHAKLQLTLLAWTGHGAATLARIRPQHVRWDTTPPEVYLQPRRKGAGANAAWLPLLPDAIEPLRAWLKLGHFQPWHAGTLRMAWKRAIVHTQAVLRKENRHAEAELLNGMRVYDLRHSIATALATQSGDVYAVSEYLQHADIRTTLGYMSGASSARVKTAIAALGATVPRDGATRSPSLDESESLSLIPVRSKSTH